MRIIHQYLYVTMKTNSKFQRFFLLLNSLVYFLRIHNRHHDLCLMTTFKSEKSYWVVLVTICLLNVRAATWWQDNDIEWDFFLKSRIMCLRFLNSVLSFESHKMISILLKIFRSILPSYGVIVYFFSCFILTNKISYICSLHFTGKCRASDLDNSLCTCHMCCSACGTGCWI